MKQLVITVIIVSFACQIKDSNAIATTWLMKSKRRSCFNTMDISTVHMNLTTTGARGESRSHWNYQRLYIYPVISVIILLTNMLIVASVLKHKRLHTPPNVFIINTAIADLLTALITVPIMLLSQTAMAESVCGITVLRLFPLQSSLLSVFAICIDRFICVVRPLSYRRWMTVKKAAILSAGFWMFNISLWLPAVFVTSDSSAIYCIEYIPNFSIFGIVVIGSVVVTMTILYGLICRTALTHRNRIRDISVSLRTVDTENDYKLRKMMITILGIFYICWLPQFILMTYGSASAGIDEGLMPLIFLSEILLLCNSFMNSFVYGYQSRQFRAAFKSILRMKIIDEDKEALCVS